jgi:hypothetical protein
MSSKHKWFVGGIALGTLFGAWIKGALRTVSGGRI